MLVGINDLLKQAVSLSLLGKCVAAIIGILLIHAAFHVLEQKVPRRFGPADARYRVRKFVVFSGYLTIILFLAVLFEDRLGRLSFAIGVIGAGVAVALQDVVASIAGAFSIGFSKLYAVGDRVQIGDTRGDVIDIGLLRTTLMETGNWVSRDSYNGRVVRIPNSIVLKASVFNYSQGFRFVWDEIKAVFSATSDYQFANEMLLRIGQAAVSEYLPEAQISWKYINENFRIENSSLEPSVSLVVNGGSLEFCLSYVVDYTKRTALKTQLFTHIIEEVRNSQGRLEWASQTVTLTGPPAAADAVKDPSSSTRGAGQAAASR
jgi:small-conductance mechanosensitive channel